MAGRGDAMMTPQGSTPGQEGFSTQSTGAQCVTRFAPSPTGLLHLGHAYSAVLASDYARQRDGVFRLRIEDIDPGRVRAAFVDDIFEDLGWLGLEWDLEIVFQSDRLSAYSAALDRLRGEGLIYPCFCTRSEIAAEIAASASAPHGAEGPPYPGTCRRLGADEAEERMSTRPHAWRLAMAKAVQAAGTFLSFREGEGDVAVDPALFGDVVLARKDAPASYHLAVTVDDAHEGVTDVIRGMDLFASTHVHRLLQALLDLPTPTYHHHSLILDDQGRRLAKRHGAPTLAELRAAGMDGCELAEKLRAHLLPAGYSLAAP
jgi:glutamyl-Q tRNA(Asp) synthetase